jgi:hypothetical protein
MNMLQGIIEMLCPTSDDSDPAPEVESFTIAAPPATYDEAPPGQNMNQSAGAGRNNPRPSASYVRYH